MGGHRLLGGQGRWWKFDRYELKDGHVLGAAGAVLKEYDPWELYERSRTRKSTQPPYAALLGLARKIQEVREPEEPEDNGEAWESRALKNELANAVLEFCQQYGLLGILPHQALQVSIPTRFLYSLGSGEVFSALYLRGSGGWDSIVPPNSLYGWDYRRWGLDSTVFLRRGPGGPLYADKLTGYWSRFFPSVRNPEFYPFPRPLSEGFWEIYAEPVDLFLKAVLWMGDCGNKERYPNQLYLNDLMGAVGVGVDDKGRFMWLSPSLLAYFALMFVVDMNGKRVPHDCPGCGRIFIGDPRALYCDEACSWRVQKGRQRRGRRSSALSTGNIRAAGKRRGLT
jgi:hypothetical protein